VIMSVADDTPAKKAGLQIGDIITKLADWKIETLVDLEWVLFYAEMGSTAEIEVLINGKIMTLDVVLFKFRHH